MRHSQDQHMRLACNERLQFRNTFISYLQVRQVACGSRRMWKKERVVYYLSATLDNGVRIRTRPSIEATSSSSSRLDCWYFSTASCFCQPGPYAEKGGNYAVFLLPVITFLLGSSDLSLKVLSLDIDLA